jgi:hypothetical protein
VLDVLSTSGSRSDFGRTYSAVDERRLVRSLRIIALRPPPCGVPATMSFVSRGMLASDGTRSPFM